MAFTDSQKASIRKYLGWETRYLQFDVDLEVAMNAILGETQTLIEGELARCVQIDTDIDAAKQLFPVDVVGSIKLSSGRGDQLGLLRSLGRQAAARIAALLGVIVRHDAFSPTSTSSTGGGGNMLPIG